MKNNPLSRKDNLVVQEVDKEILIYDLNINKAYCLNETCALVWQLCDGTRSALEISEILSQKMKSPASEDLVWLTIEKLNNQELLKNDVKITRFDGMTRREVVKKVGLGTMIALPIVASLVAPSSLFAQSCAGTLPIGTNVSGTCSANPGTGNQPTCVSCCCSDARVCALAGVHAPGDNCVKDCRCASGNCMSNGMCA